MTHDAFNFASLLPLGQGTELVESLYSYALRLAHAHSIRPNTFVQTFGPLTGQNQRTAAGWTEQLHDTSFSGCGSETLAWVNFLERKTGVAGLGQLTTLCWGHTLTRRGSGASVRKWCPHCLDDSLAHGAPYTQLAWTIGIVTACPVHECKLETACPHCDNGRTATGRAAKRFAFSAPGVCGGCDGWLGAYDAREKSLPPRAVEAASGHEVSIAAQVASVLAKPLKEGESLSVYRVLDAAASRYFGSSMVALAQWLGLNKSTVHGWMKGTVVPELGRLVELSLKLRMPLRDLLVGNVAALPDTLIEKSANLRSYDRAAANPHEKRAGILALLDRDPEISARGIAREIGINHRDVYHHAGDEVREHTEITRTVTSDVRQIELAEAAAAVEATLDQCRDRGQAPTMRALQAAATSTSRRLTYAEQQQVVSRVLAAPAGSAP